jgi:hypothetical protein
MVSAWSVMYRDGQTVLVHVLVHVLPHTDATPTWQVERAVETEINSGPAGPPSAADAGCVLQTAAHLCWQRPGPEGMCAPVPAAVLLV